MSNKFQLGRTVATPGALAALQVVGIAPSALLHRHQQGDWGDVSEHDARQNEIALLYGSRILSAYLLPTGVRIWVITEGTDEHGNRESTCLLLPSEY